MSKARRKIKKKWKTLLEKKVREAYRKEKYLWVTLEMPALPCHDFERVYFLFRIFYYRENAKQKNEDINDLANIFADFEMKGSKVFEFVRLRIEDSFPVNEEFTGDSWPVYRAFNAMIHGVERKKYGKAFGTIMKDYHKLYDERLAEFDKEVDKDKVLSSMLRLVREYDVAVFSYMKAFWYKPWLQELAHEERIPLPTHNL